MLTNKQPYQILLLLNHIAKCYASVCSLIFLGTIIQHQIWSPFIFISKKKKGGQISLLCLLHHHDQSCLKLFILARVVFKNA